MKLKKFLLGGLLAIAGFASVYAIIQPNINGLTATTSITPSSAYIMTQDGTTQRRISAENFANSISGSFPLDEYYPLAGNSISNPITGALFIGDNTGSYNVEVTNTPLNFGVVLDVYGPVITPNAYVPGFGAYPTIITKGINFFLGETGSDTSMYLSNVDGTFATVFNSRSDEAKFSLAVMSGNLTSAHNAWTFDIDGTIKSELIDPTPYIIDPTDFTTKKYVDDNMPVLDDYVTLSTSQKITGAKEFTGGVIFEGPVINYIDWVGGTPGTTGWSTDENGIEYIGYSCSNFDPNSLVNKSCIEDMITTTPLDYLPLAGNSELTAISGDVYFQPSRTLQRGEVGVLNGYINYSDVSKEISMNSYDLSTNKNGFMRIQDGYPEMGYSHAGSFRFVKLQTGGLVYQADYSGDYTNRSLVDKEYVDSELGDYVTLSTNQTIDGIKTIENDMNFPYALGSVLFTNQTNDEEWSRIWSSGLDLVSFQKGSDGVNLDLSLDNLTEDRLVYFPDATGTIVLDTNVSDVMSYPGTSGEIVSSIAITDYLDGIAGDLGDVLTTGGYYLSGDNRNRIQWSGTNLLFQNSTDNLTYTTMASMSDGGIDTIGLTVEGTKPQLIYAQGERSVATFQQANYSGTTTTAGVEVSRYTSNTFTNYFGPLFSITDTSVYPSTGDLMKITKNTTYGTDTAFVCKYDGKIGIGTNTPTQALTVSGAIGFDNGTDMPFRFAYSGGLMEGQYYTGGTWVSAVQYTLP